MGLVSTWLNGIGLGHAIPAFRAAGIVTPTDLAEVELHMYEDLGVTKSTERKKLFYLVQRIKMAVDDSSRVEEEEEDFRRPTSQRMASGSSRSSRYDDEEEDYSDEYDDEEYSSEERYDRHRYDASETSETSRSERRGYSSRSRFRSDSEVESSSSSRAPSPPPHRDLDDHESYDEVDSMRQRRNNESARMRAKLTEAKQRRYKDQRSEVLNNQRRIHYREEEDEVGDLTVKTPRNAPHDHVSPMSEGSFNFDEDAENHDVMSVTKGGGKSLVKPRERVTSSIAVTKKKHNAAKGTSGLSAHGMRALRTTPTKAKITKDSYEDDDMMTPSPEPRRGIRDRKGPVSHGHTTQHRHMEGHDEDFDEYDDGSFEEEKKETHDSRAGRSKDRLSVTREGISASRSVSETKSSRVSKQRPVTRQSLKLKQQRDHSHLNVSTQSEHSDEESVSSRYSTRSSRSSLRSGSLKTTGKSSRKMADVSSVVSMPEAAARRKKEKEIESRRSSRSSVSSGRISIGSSSSRPGSARQGSVSKLAAKISADRKSLSRSSASSVGGDSRASRGNRSTKSISTAPVVSSSSDNLSTPLTRSRVGTAATTASRGRRLESKIQNPTRSKRAGAKRLSTIPSESVAPMSPLVALDASQLDQTVDIGRGRLEQMAAVSRAKKKESNMVTPTTSRSRSASAKRQATGKSEDLCKSVDYLQSKSKTRGVSRERRGRRSESGISHERSRSNSSQRSASSRGHVVRRDVSTAASNSSIASSRTARKVTKSAANRYDRSKSPTRAFNSSFESDVGSEALNTSTSSLKYNVSSAPSSGNGPVFVHGVPEDNSWAAQVGQLREDNDHDHHHQNNSQQNSASYENEEEEMRIRVIVRKRPMSKKESAVSGEVDIIHPLEFDSYGKILVYQPKTRVDLTREVETLPFAFDNVFDENANNVQIYERTVRNLIPGVFEGRWASVFAYGQTGSGKTFTMMGCNMTGMKAGSSSKAFENLGLYYLAAQDVFTLANEPEYRHLSVGASLFEIYGGKLFDLLNKREPIKCLENHKGKVCFPGLSEHPVSSAENLMEVIEAGAMNRSTGTTSANADSSRSHAVLQLSLRKQVGRKAHVEHGRLTFIDLAGSERGADTNKASRTTRLEGAEINTSLLALKEVIRALATGDSMKHIPFRGSKLTQVLKESFVGKNSRTVMVSCVAPNMGNCEHTLNTLRYADRVKERDAETGKLAAAVVAGSRIQSTTNNSKSKLLQRPVTAPATSADSDEIYDRGNTSEPRNTRKDSIFGSLCDNDNDDGDELNNENDSSYIQSSDAVKENLMESMVFEDEDENDNGEWEEESLDLNKSDNIAVPAELERRLPQRSPSDRKVKTVPKIKDRPKSAPVSNKEAAKQLISTHRSVMTGMLGMVKHEMSLVNYTDADRETIENYLVELEKVQEEKLSMISTLRQSLLDYYASRGDVPPKPKHMHESADFSEVLSDGSVEDLRD